MTRIRITGGPWPERIGAEGVIVEAPAGYRRYPFGHASTEVVVLLDDDPVAAPKDPADYGGAAWTCVVSRLHVEEAP